MLLALSELRDERPADGYLRPGGSVQFNQLTPYDGLMVFFRPSSGEIALAPILGTGTVGTQGILLGSESVTDSSLLTGFGVPSGSESLADDARLITLTLLSGADGLGEPGDLTATAMLLAAAGLAEQGLLSSATAIEEAAALRDGAVLVTFARLGASQRFPALVLVHFDDRAEQDLAVGAGPVQALALTFAVAQGLELGATRQVATTTAAHAAQDATVGALREYALAASDSREGVELTAGALRERIGLAADRAEGDDLDVGAGREAIIHVDSGVTP